MQTPPELTGRVALVFLGTLGVSLVTAAAGLWVSSFLAAPWLIAALQTLLVGVFAEWSLRRTWASALREHDALVSSAFSGGRYLWSHSRHAAKMALADVTDSPPWSSFGWTAVCQRRKVSLAIEGSTWTLLVEADSGRRGWCWRATDFHPYWLTQYAAPPARWGQPVPREALAAERSFLPEVAGRHAQHMLDGLDGYRPALFVHPTMVRLLLHDVGQGAPDALWHELGAVVDDLIALAEHLGKADVPDETSDLFDIFYRDWFSTVEEQARASARLILGGTAALVLGTLYLGYAVLLAG